MTILWVGLGGFLGAIARYLLASAIAERWGGKFPCGILIVNITGSFVLGFFMAFAQSRSWIQPNFRLLFAVGIVGGYTTFSTFTYDSVRLALDGKLLLATTNVSASVLLGCLAVMAGIIVGGRV
jgi:CrcB protein